MKPRRFYDDPIPGHTVYRFDLLYALKDVIGEPLYKHRDFSYNTVAGIPDEQSARDSIATIYDVFPDARAYINDVILYKSAGNTPMYVIEDMLSKIQKYRTELNIRYDTSGIKILPESHLYYYISPRYVIDTPTDGIKIE